MLGELTTFAGGCFFVCIGAREHLSLSDKARAGVAGGISQSSFVRACVASADKQHKVSALFDLMSV